MSISQSIRAALQLRAATAAGFPASDQIAYEGVVFTSTTGVPWARMWMMPQSGRPFSVDGGTTIHRGLFQVDTMVPDGQGTAAAEIAADAVRVLFRAGTRISQGSDTIIVDYSERGPAQQQPDWIFCPVTVAWRCYSQSN